MNIGSSEIKGRVEYNSWAFGLSNWMDIGIIYETGQYDKGASLEEEAGTLNPLSPTF